MGARRTHAGTARLGIRAYRLGSVHADSTLVHTDSAPVSLINLFGLKFPKRLMARKKRKPEDRWEVLPAGEMRRKYGLYAENRPAIKLDPNRVPEPLRALIPLAERFGISDDLLREDFFAKTPKRELSRLKQTLAEYDKFLDEWLAGPEADGPEFSDEYVAFSAMRMGVDCL
jgi:hypothetical protein